MAAFLITSAKPAARSRLGNDARVATSIDTRRGWWKDPTRFLPSGRLTPVLPPTLASTIESTVVGICTKGMPRRKVGAVERAWLLVGGLDHDPGRGAAAIRAVTAVDVAMGRGGASQTHFAFEPGPFVEARERALRDFDGLAPVGWAHSHPPCEACPANPTCPSETRFFSADDVEVHSSAFASAYMIALVVGKAATAPATEPGFHLYGWRDARIVKLDYRVASAMH